MRLTHPNNDRLRRLIGSNFALLACVLFALPSRAQTAETRVDCESISSPSSAVQWIIASRSRLVTMQGLTDIRALLPSRLFEHARSWSEHSGSNLETLMSQGKIGKYIVVMPEGATVLCNPMTAGSATKISSSRNHPGDRSQVSTIANRTPAGSAAFRWGAMERAPRHEASGRFRIGQRPHAALIAKFPDPLPTEGRGDSTRRSCRSLRGAAERGLFDANIR